METKQENIVRTDYSEIMQKSYIDYAMSVIISRALPDVRDGLKPVQRRTLYDMYELGIRYDRPYRKCARIVGDTMGKYHPHGDSSIYEALVVMAQEFKKGKTLVDGHGNFGSIEGDGAAAMRYTEARLEKLTQEVFLEDLDKNVVDFVPNFDETEKEPSVLPVKIPNLLVNGAEGIAVGMATSIPPHNLGEVIDAVKAYMKDNQISVRGLMRYIKGPDFPTGGIVVNKDDLCKIYETGTGKLRIRGRVTTEKLKGGKKQLVITEIPYTMLGANIGKFLNDVASLVETKKTTDIMDISNQSSKEGIRIVLELKKDTDVENLTNMLYKKTRLEDTFGVNMLAIAHGRPETLNLKGILDHYLEFQYENTTRKYQALLDKELERKEIREGLIQACNVIDLIIAILRGSKNLKDAKACLMYGDISRIQFKHPGFEEDAKQLHFTEKQAAAILEMRLYKLIGLEIMALEKEYKECLKKIARYEKILKSRDAMNQVIQEDLKQIKEEFAVSRRTVIEDGKEAVYEEAPMEVQEVVFVMDRFGYCKLLDRQTYERNQETVDQEYKHRIPCLNTDKICIFTNTGSLHQVKVMEIPFGKLRDKGTPIDNVSKYDGSREEIVFLTCFGRLTGQMLLFATRMGMMKQVPAEEFITNNRTVVATKLQEGDQVAVIRVVGTETDLVIQTTGDVFLRFSMEEIPEMKKASRGVRGIRMSEGEALEEIYFVSQNPVITYKKKEVHLNRLKIAKRDGKGSKVRL